MKQSLSKLLVFSSLLALLSACDNTPGVYGNKGDPEQLIDVSSEVVTLSLAPKNSLTKLTAMVRKDPPASARLACSFKDTRCTQAKEIFDRNNIPVKLASGDKGNTVTLSYERVVVRDCDPRYVNNSINNSSTNHPAFACAVTGNMVQMVSDKRQFTNPSLLDFPDAEKATQYQRAYLSPPSAGGSGGSGGAGMQSGTGAPPK